MRFSIRDLLWLMAVVALAATLYAARVQLQQLVAKWTADWAAREQRFAAEQQQLTTTVTRLDQENAILKHQMTLRLQEDLKREAAELERRSAATPRPNSPRFVAPTVALPDDLNP